MVGPRSTGIVKVLVIVASAVVAVALQPERSRLASAWPGCVLVAACANVWNGLDVRPGRAIKFGLVAMSWVSRAWTSRCCPRCRAWRSAPSLALWLDLRERAMLGDGGANLLGFTIGLGLYLVLAGLGVWCSGPRSRSAINAVGETVTLSRVIDAVPPLRWFDAFGRLPA